MVQKNISEKICIVSTHYIILIAQNVTRRYTSIERKKPKLGYVGNTAYFDIKKILKNNFKSPLVLFPNVLIWP